MEMSIDEAVLELRWLKIINQGILETDATELDADSAWVKHWECVTQALDIAIDTARNYQMMQANYNARLKADLEAILVELQTEIEELDSRAGYDGSGMPTFSTDYIRKKKVNELIQQKINELKAESEPQESEDT